MGEAPQVPMILIQYVMRAESLQAENESAARLSHVAIRAANGLRGPTDVSDVTNSGQRI